jgi:hypothetical protein
LAAERRLQGLRDLLGADAQRLRLVAIDADAHFGLAEFQVAVHEGEHRAAAQFFQEFRQGLAERIDVRTLHDEAHAADAATAFADGRLLRDIDSRAGELALQHTQVFGDLLLRTLAAVAILQEHAHEAVVDRTLRAAVGGAALLRYLRHHQVRFGHPLGGGLGNIVEKILHVIVARAVGAVGAHPQAATVFERRQLARQQVEEQINEAARRDEYGQPQPATPQHAAETASVRRFQPIEKGLGDTKQPAVPLVRFQQPRAQHGRESQRDQRGDQHRARDGHAEFAKQSAGQSAHEQQR